MSTYNQLIHQYKRELKEKDISLQTVKLFLFELCNDYSVDLYVEMDKEAKEEIETRFHEGVKRLLNDEPLNYVLGYSYFFGYRMVTDPRVLIPRYETEELIGLILGSTDEFMADKEKIVCADIGTGSGAIAIALKKEEDRLEMYATDISEEALEVANRNAKNNEADVSFFAGDMLEPIRERGIRLDVLVSNPPYIPSEEKMEKSVVDYEPHVALFGGSDGLYFYRVILTHAREVMNDHGMIFFEMGWDQRERLSALAKEHFPEANIEVFKDINQKDRMMRIIF